ncbi:MAG: glycosyltransferase [Methanobacterium sp.]|nr:glycosyltransferase [Methanobacterium sp.]
MIKITLGIIARNEEKNISETLTTILKQSINPSEYEILIVDGNSTDNTRNIAASVLKNSNVQYKIINEADHGFYGHCFARNLVIDNSAETAEYIAFTDADCLVDTDWLETLYKSIKKTDDHVAGAGGPRLIAKTNSKTEMIINSLITSYIASGANPAFHSRNIKYVKSIANYNAIYKKSVIAKFRYDESLIMSDDNELNFRLRKAGYLFLNVPEAKIWHHETGSIKEFASNMFKYGVNISNTVKKHRSMITINVPLTTIFIAYLILLTPLYYFFGTISLVPIVLYLFFSVLVFLELIMRTGSVYSILVFVLLPIEHIAYGLGVYYNLLKR